MGGIGKTSLAGIFLRQVERQFDFIVWRSLRESPSISKILIDLIKVLSGQQETDFPDSVGDRIRSVIQYLEQSRCLIVLDNAESIMKTGTYNDRYLPGYEEYGILLERFGRVKRQSCLILTSRVKPASISALEGKTKPVRCLSIEGLKPIAARAILWRTISQCQLRPRNQIVGCSARDLRQHVAGTYRLGSFGHFSFFGSTAAQWQL
jgi:hypothetical protein